MLGCTPEIILSGEKGKWHTVALAGTQPLQNGELPIEWDDKNREEQEYVAFYIRKQLQALGIKPTENSSDPGTRRRTVAFEKRLQLSTAR
mgnify:CR=1 FL=1